MFSFKSLFLALFALFVTGCGRYHMINCTPEQEAYIGASLDWMQEHADEIEGTMSGFWPKRQTSLEHILAALGTTPIECGVGRKEGDSIAATTRNFPDQIVIVDTSHVVFVDGLRKYNESTYVTDYSPEELADPNVVDPVAHSPMNDVLNYHVARADLGFILAHEGAHVILGGHDHLVDKAAEQLAKDDSLDSDVMGMLDEIYGWGAAVEASAEAIYLPEWEAVVDATQ